MADALLRDLIAVPAPIAQLLGAACFAADLWSRSFRMQVMTRGAGGRLRFRDALALTAFGDAAAAVTPWRAGGEVARVLGARTSGVALPVIVAVIGVETLIVYALATLVGAWLVAAYGGEWMRLITREGPLMSRDLVYGLTVVALVALVLVISIPAIRYRLLDGLRGLRSSALSARRIPVSVLVWCLVLSVISLVSRVAILPLLALAVAPVPLGVIVLVSFTLLHSQMALPTPAGAGPIELAFMNGAVGLTTHAGWVLGWWRVYTTLLPIVAGFFLGAHAYGKQVLRVLPFGGKRNAV